MISSSLLARMVAVSLLLGVPLAPGLRSGASARVVLAGRHSIARITVLMVARRGPFEEAEYWGTSRAGGRVVRGVDVRVDSLRILMPRSAYADLANVDSVKVMAVRESLIVTLLGGGDGNGYSCRYVVVGGRLRSRHVEAHSSDASEETRYVWPPPEK